MKQNANFEVQKSVNKLYFDSMKSRGLLDQ